MFNFCWHEWGMWSPVIRDYNGSLRQVCRCSKCGAIKHRTAISIISAQLQTEQVTYALEHLDPTKETA